MRRTVVFILLAICLSLPLLASSISRPADIMNAAEIGLALERLNVLGTALYLAAHPDDENTALISWLSKERQLRTGYLALTRGDGGQNLIGEEKGTGLGVIRTQELLAARSIDGGNQFFSRAVDFGYTKSSDETMQVWGHDEILADTVWVIRKFQPDVIITRFPTTGEGGHGQHTASAMFAVEAFEAAADPARFPEQLAHVKPWQVRRVFWDDFRPYFRRSEGEVDMSGSLQVDIGTYNERLGRSYTEIAGVARSMHKSQGFGAAERRGSFINYLSLTRGDDAATDPFEGIDMSWSRIEGAEEIESAVRKAIAAWNPDRPSEILPQMTAVLQALDAAGDSRWIRIKRDEVREIIRSASGLWLEAIVEEASAIPGNTAKVRLTAINRSSAHVRLLRARSVWASTAEEPVELEPNKPEQIDLEVAIPADAEITQPYWLEKPSSGGRYEVEDLTLVGSAENGAALVFTFEVELGDRAIEYEVPVLHRRVDPVKGEIYRPFVIEPAITVGFEQPFYLFPNGETREIRVMVRAATTGVRATVGLDVPTGWSVEPASSEVSLSDAGDEALTTFRLTAINGKGVSTISAWARQGEQRFASSRAAIEYDHIPMQVWYAPAEARLVRENLRKTGERVGYVEGSGDEIPDALRQVGYEVQMLDESTLAGGDLSSFDTIVVGVRALNTRADVVRHYDRLLDYVENGGTLVVQYNTLSRDLPATLGPWPLKISRDRITEEDSKMSFAVPPDHPLLSKPNVLSESDFDGWVQERGLYFPSEWDDRYDAILSGADTGEEPLKGALLYGRHGKGVFIYTGISFFRQLPAGVPGAYKLFLNLVSAR